MAASKEITVTHVNSTVKNLQKILAQKPGALHFSGHCLKMAESEKGAALVLETEETLSAEYLYSNDLKKMLIGNQLDFVFLESKGSECIAPVFI